MPLFFDPPLPDDLRASVASHPQRRVFCTGCGFGKSYESHQWVFPPEQIEAWIEEHAEHETPATAKAAKKKPTPASPT